MPSSERILNYGIIHTVYEEKEEEEVPEIIVECKHDDGEKIKF